MNYKENDDYNVRQDECISEEMTSKLAFSPHCCGCSGCTQNREIDECMQFIVKLNKDIDNEKVCPYAIPYTI